MRGGAALSSAPPTPPPLPLWPRPVPRLLGNPGARSTQICRDSRPARPPTSRRRHAVQGGQSPRPGDPQRRTERRSRGPAHGARGRAETEQRAPGGGAGAEPAHRVGQARAAGAGRQPGRASDMQQDNGQAAGQWLDLWPFSSVTRVPLPGSVCVSGGGSSQDEVGKSRCSPAPRHECGCPGAVPRP